MTAKKCCSYISIEGFPPHFSLTLHLYEEGREMFLFYRSDRWGSEW